MESCNCVEKLYQVDDARGKILQRNNLMAPANKGEIPIRNSTLWNLIVSSLNTDGTPKPFGKVEVGTTWM